MNAEFFEAVEDIEAEKGIPRAYMYDKIKQAMLAAFRRDCLAPGEMEHIALPRVLLDRAPMDEVTIEIEEA